MLYEKHCLEFQMGHARLNVRLHQGLELPSRLPQNKANEFPATVIKYKTRSFPVYVK